MRAIEEIKADVADCHICETNHDCLGMVSNCKKQFNVEYYENELLRAVTANIPIDRLQELCTIERITQQAQARKD